MRPASCRRQARRFSALVVGAAVLLSARAIPLTAQESRPATELASGTVETWALITYLSGGTVYLNAGSRAGLAEGSRGTVLRNGAVIVELTVTAVSSTRAAATVANGTDSVVVGDSVRFLVVVTQERRVAPDAPVASKPGAVRRNGRPLRGRVGLRYLAMSQEGAAGLTRPALDLRLDGQRLGGSPFGVALDVRATRTRLGNRPGGSQTALPTGRTLVHQAALLLDGAESPGRLSIGRQYSTALPAIGLFDGVAADFSWRHVGMGAFAGSQPDVSSFGLSGDIREYGAYANVHSAPGSAAVWSFTSGAIGSYARDAVNREFLYLQGMYFSRTLSIYATQEIDYNRGWKSDAGEPATSVTATYAQARLALSEAVAVSAGLDSRRNVRLYRDYVNPEIEFDDAMRRGAWASASLTVGSHLFASLDARRGSGAGDMDSHTMSLSLVGLSRLGFGVRGRQTSYAADATSGRLQSVSLEAAPHASLHAELSFGQRDDRQRATPELDSRVNWFGVSADMSLGRSYFVTFSSYRENAGPVNSVQHLAALTYRF